MDFSYCCLDFLVSEVFGVVMNDDSIVPLEFIIHHLFWIFPKQCLASYM